MYHPHADEMVQMAMGMMGLFVVHPKDPKFMPVDRDFVFLLNAYDIDPGSVCPKVNTMTRLQSLDLEQPRLPRHRPLVVRKDDKVRIRIGNLTMTNHPIHMHGYDFEVTGTDGGWVPRVRAWPEVTVDVAVGQMRAFEFDADISGRLGDPLPQVASHDERDGPRRADDDRRRQAGNHQAASASSCPATWRWAIRAWPTWARWRCRCPRTRCR
jgi:FtsP/CotA-like multicopper oxidase with cupredoxin domain